ncbi:tkl protein kinase [Plasmopara halstedii]|uniref:Tkl protein kinase n=1 Tax=Plasmopara halstedii TaxID=4781 RepID=A0A0P1A714_PLAHL|nr:tkl protein kinase [Plasmopara halstedii]CEG36413.1 tkl protein kinase [Plasmopara halstedii]|eukprot:XP_024572782.1 tkl protein kinase [Plasmopara halstedii]
MGCTSSKSKNDAHGPMTGRSNEANYSNLAVNINNGNFSASQNVNQPRRSMPASRNQRNGSLGSTQAVNRIDSENCFPELVKFRLDESEVLLTRKVSSGAFGVVWLGHYHGQPVAVKRMIDGEDEAISFSREIETMSRLSHPKIVRFIGCTWTNKKDLGGVSEYMDGGDIIHRDLKSRNVLLNSDMVAKLSDFGLSRNRTYEETLTAGVGTVRWTAPEVMLGDNYSEQADVYSFGVVLSELDTREIPFEEKSSKTGASGAPDMAIVIKVAKGELRPSFAPDCPDVILRIARACLQFDPALRPASESIVQMLNDARVQLQAM